jgi:hypothetical protein
MARRTGRGCPSPDIAVRARAIKFLRKSEIRSIVDFMTRSNRPLSNAAYDKKSWLAARAIFFRQVSHKPLKSPDSVEKQG